MSSSCFCPLSFSLHLRPLTSPTAEGAWQRACFSELPTVTVQLSLQSCIFRALSWTVLSCFLFGRGRTEGWKSANIWLTFHAGLFLAVGDEAARTCLGLDLLTGQKPVSVPELCRIEWWTVNRAAGNWQWLLMFLLTVSVCAIQLPRCPGGAAGVPGREPGAGGRVGGTAWPGRTPPSRPPKWKRETEERNVKPQGNRAS